MAELDFDTNEYTGNFSLKAIPNGRYKVVIVDSIKKLNKQQTGSLLKLTFEVIEGEHKGAKVFVNLNLWNASPVAVKLAREEMTAISHACGVPRPRSSEELHNTPIFIDVTCEKRDGTEDKWNNRITAYYSVRQAAAQAPRPSADVAPYKRAAASAASPAPWGAKAEQPPQPALNDNGRMGDTKG